MQHSTRKPTIYEAERIEAMLRLGCCACAILEIWHPAECHHMTMPGKRYGHWWTLPLCSGHHRGDWNYLQTKLIPKDKRVALSDGTKAWERVYPSQRVLFERVQMKLGLSAAWPTSKILPRRTEGLCSS